MCAGTWTPQANLSTRQVLAKLARGRESGFEEVVISGGEPTVRDDIVLIAQTARAMGYTSFVLQTNGRRLKHSDLAAALINGGVTRFVISLHGHAPGIHDGITRIRGSFEEVIAGIHNVQHLSANTTRLAIHFVVLPINFSGIPAVVRLMCELDIPILKLSYVVPVGRASGIYKREQVPSMTDTLPYLFEGIDWFVAHYRSQSKTSVSIGYYPLCVLGDYVSFSDEVCAPPTYFMDDDCQLKLADLEIQERGLKVKRPDCQVCDYYRECSGVWHEYPQSFGWSEFTPIVRRGSTG